MPFGEPTTIPAVLSAFVDQIVASCELDTSQVFLSLADDHDVSQFPPKDVFVQVAPREMVPIDGHVDGGGNSLFTCELTVAVNLWVRLGLDVVFQDADQLNHATLGHLVTWVKVLKALQQFYPAAETGAAASIFAEPARCLRFAFQPRNPTNGWAKLPGLWRVPAVLDLS